MKKLVTIMFLCLLFFNNANAACDDAPGDGVDYEGCAFSDEQNLTGTYLPNSNLSFTGFIKVIFDKSNYFLTMLTQHVMMLQEMG